jgi:hypothetical protein
MGAIAGLAAAIVHRRAAPGGDEERAQWRWLLTPVAAALAYGLADPLGGSGFIAAFVAGLVFGALGGARRRSEEPLPAQDLGTLLNALTFVAFGAAFMKPLIERATWQVALYALLSLTVVRMLPVAVAMVGTRSRPADGRLSRLVRPTRARVDRVRRPRRRRAPAAHEHDRRRRRADRHGVDRPARAERRPVDGALRTVGRAPAAANWSRGGDDERARSPRRRPVAAATGTVSRRLIGPVGLARDSGAPPHVA